MGIDFNKLNGLFVNPRKIQVSTDEAKAKKADTDVPIGKPAVQPEDKMVGMDTFVRTTNVAQTNGAEALAMYNQVQIKRSDKMPQVNASPVATEARLSKALANMAPILAEEAGIPAMATVNGISQEILNNVNVNPLLAQYLNSADHNRIELAMQPFMQLA